MMKYADRKKISHVVIIGEDERKKGLVCVKNMLTGNQQDLKLSDLAEWLKNRNQIR